MSNETHNVKLQLTPEQRDQIRNMTGKDASVIEFSVEELEERIAPGTVVSLTGDQAEDRIAPATGFPNIDGL